MSNHRRKSLKRKQRIQDHAQWSAYLDRRCILEQAIAAGAWIEYSDYYGRYSLVWHEKRRDGSQGARRRRFIDPPVINGKKVGKSIWYPREKTDEPFYYQGSLHDLKQAIAQAKGELKIVEGEIGVWSMHALGIRNVIGIYGISNIPKEIAAILDELGVVRLVYYADNDKAGELGASNLRTLLHRAGWGGEQEHRKFEGPGIPDRGDANDLLYYHFPDIAQARVALTALPTFQPPVKPERPPRLSTQTYSGESGLDAIKDAICAVLGIQSGDFKSNGYSPDICCIIKEHEGDKENPSAGWHRDGHFKCFKCHGPGEFLNTIETAELLEIDWRAILRAYHSTTLARTNIDLTAAPQTKPSGTPLAFEKTPDTWLRMFIEFYKRTEAVFFFFAMKARNAGLLADGFTRPEFMNALRDQGCKVSKRTIDNVFEEVLKDDNHTLLAKLDSSIETAARSCLFRLRSLDDIRRRLSHHIRYRTYERTFHKHKKTLINFEAFAEALQRSDFASELEFALAPLYEEQEQRFNSLRHICDQKIAAHSADLDDLSSTSLPADWTIDKPCELPALLARGIYDADPEDRSKAEWARLLGISESSVPAALERAGIRRIAYTVEVTVDSTREAREQARQRNAKIGGVKMNGVYQLFEAEMEIPRGTQIILQPLSRHEIISDKKQALKSPTANGASPDAAPAAERADNMEKPGNWHRAGWDPQFIYWELVKACSLLHGYEVRDGLGLYDPETGEIWTNPSLEQLVALITGALSAGAPDL